MISRSATRRLSFVSAFALVGCVASQGVSPNPERTSRKFTRVEDAVAALQADADGGSSDPRVRLSVLGSDSWPNYVNASAQVSEDAYLMVVAVDRDRRVHVIFPESPDESGFVTRNSSTRLTRFFAGFGRASNVAGSFAYNNASGPITRFGGAGVVLAIASDRPLQYERLADDGGWNEDEVAHFVFDASASAAARALGRALSLTGQTFTTDYSSFQSAQSVGFGTLASNAINECASMSQFGSLGPGLAANEHFVGNVAPPVVYSRENGMLYARYPYSGRCGELLYSAPVQVRERVVPVDTTRMDTTRAASLRVAAAERTSARRIPVSSIETPEGTERAPRRPGVGLRIPRTPVTGEPAVEMRDPERPRLEGGIRFRPPEQVLRRPPRDENSGGDQEQRVGGQMRPMVPRTEPVRAEPVRSEPVRSEPVRSEPVRSEPVRSEPVRSEPTRSEPARTEPVPVRIPEGRTRPTSGAQEPSQPI